MSKFAAQWMFAGVAVFAIAAGSLPQAQAMELDWTGEFRSEFNFIHDYTLDTTPGGNTLDPTRLPSNGNNGYYIPSGGSNDANFQTLFLKLKPKLVVNDNIYIKSELWLGNPAYSLYGSAGPHTTDEMQYYSTFSRGSDVTAQRYWAEFLSDIGTVQIGRAPLNWGLGIVWNSGDGAWDHYESTGDVMRLIAKFGAFSFVPSVVVYSIGDNVGGSCVSFAGGGAGNIPPIICQPNGQGGGGGSLIDYSLAVKYENPDEDFEAGVNLIKRYSGTQDQTAGYVGPVPQNNGSNLNVVSGMNYNTWDIYLKKRFGKFTLAGEAPIVSGSLSGYNYSAFALATEGDWRINDPWELKFKLGHAPGQPNTAGSDLDGTYHVFYFNPDYTLGLIMFNYALNHFVGPNTTNNSTANPLGLYDNPIVNANYLWLGGILHADKWNFHLSWMWAGADQNSTPGTYFFNTMTGQVAQNNTTETQSNSLGWETDAGATFQWDEYFQFNWEVGYWIPGMFYAFSNSAQGGPDNQTSPVLATALRVSVTF